MPCLINWLIEGNLSHAIALVGLLVTMDQAPISIRGGGEESPLGLARFQKPIGVSMAFLSCLTAPSCCLLWA
jgi:hypothetical protein